MKTDYDLQREERDRAKRTKHISPTRPITHPNAFSKDKKTGAVRHHKIGTILSPNQPTNRPTNPESDNEDTK